MDSRSSFKGGTDVRVLCLALQGLRYMLENKWLEDSMTGFSHLSLMRGTDNEVNCPNVSLLELVSAGTRGETVPRHTNFKMFCDWFFPKRFLELLRSVTQLQSWYDNAGGHGFRR